MTKNDVSSANSSAKSAKKKSPLFWRVFWLAFLVLSLAYAWHSFYVPSNEVAWADDVLSAREQASESDKNVMLFFTGDWCVPCRIMKREVFADQEVSKAINAQVVPVMINIDDPKVEEIVRLYQVGGTPVTIFTDPQGNVIDYAVGKIGKEKFMEMLQKLEAAAS